MKNLRYYIFYILIIQSLNSFSLGEFPLNEYDPTQNNLYSKNVKSGFSFESVLDSMLAINPYPFEIIVNEFYKKELSNCSENQFVMFLDSILDLDSISPSLISLTTKVAFERFPYVAKQMNFKIPCIYDTLGIPSMDLYQNWNNNLPHPDLSQEIFSTSNDTIYLIDSNYNMNYFHPIDGPITSWYGWRNGRMHRGVDIDLEVWDPVHCAFDGVVRFVRYYEAYGRLVVVRHYNGLETYYAHLHRFKVKPGDKVKAGDVIGLGGSSGRSTGSHLHFEIRYKGVDINPASIISFKEKCLKDNLIVMKQTSPQNYVALGEGISFYKVKQGDYLYKIAAEFGTTVNRLCQINGLRKNQILFVGQNIKIN